jgi:Domain of unknown function (DUF4288)
MAKVTVKKGLSASKKKTAPIVTAPKLAARTKGSATGMSKPKPALKLAPALEESWFWVCALYKSERGGKKGRLRKRHLWERRVFVIRAVRGAERRVARQVAEAHEQKYKNGSGETVYWRLKEIEAYAELFDKRITSGTEVYWTFFVKVDR